MKKSPKKNCHIYEKSINIPDDKKHAYALEDYLGFGSVQQAAAINMEVFLDAWNKLYIKSLTYEDYEVSWAFYERVYHDFSFPLTQIAQLLEKIQPYKKIFLHNLPCQYTSVIKHFYFEKKVEVRDDKNILERVHPKNFLMRIAAFMLGLMAIITYMILRRKVALRTSDKIFAGTDSDFRLEELYNQLRAQNIKFLEFVRLHDLSSVFKNIFIRKRPVIYYEPFMDALSFFIRRKNIAPKSAYNSALMAYEHDIRTIAKAIPFFKGLYKLLGIKSIWITAFSIRNAPLTIAAKCSAIKTVGMKHGAGTKDYDVYEFIPAYWSEKKLGPDAFGVWSPWWGNYFKKYNKITSRNSIKYVGLLRPYPDSQDSKQHSASQNRTDSKIRVLVLSEPLTNPAETFPYLKALARDARFSLVIKTRPMIKDSFYDGLIKLMPEAKSWPKYTGNIFEDGKNADVFLGAHTTALLEASLIGKISIFIKTQKWEDYFDLSDLVPEFNILVKTPDELAEHIILRLKQEPELKTIEKIKYRYFGENKNGAEWAAKELDAI